METQTDRTQFLFCSQARTSSQLVPQPSWSGASFRLSISLSTSMSGPAARRRGLGDDAADILRLGGVAAEGARDGPREGLRIVVELLAQQHVEARRKARGEGGARSGGATARGA